jgi:hypothetical protein
MMLFTTSAKLSPGLIVAGSVLEGQVQGAAEIRFGRQRCGRLRAGRQRIDRAMVGQAHPAGFGEAAVGVRGGILAHQPCPALVQSCRRNPLGGMTTMPQQGRAVV